MSRGVYSFTATLIDGAVILSQVLQYEDRVGRNSIQTSWTQYSARSVIVMPGRLPDSGPVLDPDSIFSASKRSPTFVGTSSRIPDGAIPGSKLGQLDRSIT